MKLTLKQEWKPRPLNSFLGVIDLKIGVTIAFLFAVRPGLTVDENLLNMYSKCSYLIRWQECMGSSQSLPEDPLLSSACTYTPLGLSLR